MTESPRINFVMSDAYTLSKLSRFGFKDIRFLIHNRAIFRTIRLIRHGNGFMEEWMSKFTRGSSVFHTSMRNKQVELNPYILYFIKIIPFWL